MSGEDEYLALKVQLYELQKAIITMSQTVVSLAAQISDLTVRVEDLERGLVFEDEEPLPPAPRYLGLPPESWG